MFRSSISTAQPGQFMGGGAAATLDILQQVQKAGSAQAFRNTVHVKDEALLLRNVNNEGWGEDDGEQEEEEGSAGIRGRIARVVDAAAQAKWFEHQRQVQAAAAAHLELSMPLSRRAIYLKQRVEQKQVVESEKKEAEQALVDEEQETRPADFDFTGEGRPYRFALGKASRIRGGRGVARDLGVQLREGQMKLADKDGTVRHAEEPSPVGGLGLAGLLAHARVRCPYRDFIVEWARDNAIHYTGTPGGWRDGGLRLAVLGSGLLLFELELVARIRGLGIRIDQICLVDKAYKWPVIGTMRALQEFADFQRATAILAREAPAEILVYGALSDYMDTIKDKAKCCHLLMHCDSFQEGLIEDDDCEKLALQILVHGGLMARISNMRSGMGFAAAAWTLVPGGPAYQGGVDLSSLNDPLLVACNDAISSPQIQMKVQMQAVEWEKKQRLKMQMPLAAEVKEAPRTTKTQAELDEAEERYKAEDRARGLSEAQCRARARMRARQFTGSAETKAQPIRRTALQERAAHYGLDVWRVIHDPHVAVRAAPKGTAKIIGQLAFGQEIMASKDKKGDWVRISEGPVTVDLPTDAWVLLDTSEGKGMGMMFEKVEV